MVRCLRGHAPWRSTKQELCELRRSFLLYLRSAESTDRYRRSEQPSGVNSVSDVTEPSDLMHLSQFQRLDDAIAYFPTVYAVVMSSTPEPKLSFRTRLRRAAALGSISGLVDRRGA